jgi:hypothetical protein
LTSRRLLATGALIVVLAAFFAALKPVDRVEAVPTDYGGTTIDQISYNAATDTLTWRYVIRSTATFGFTINVAFNPGGPSRFVGHAPPVCTPAPSQASQQAGPLSCVTPINAAPNFGQLILNAQAIVPQTCAASTFTIPGLTLSNWPGTGNPEPPIQVPGPGSQAIPADTALCPTPIPNTPTPTPTLVPPAVVPVIPQVFQHPVGGIFNGSRNNTPTPVRPVGTAGSTGVGLPPTGAAAMPALRPPSTGDAGLLPLRRLAINAW